MGDILNVKLKDTFNHAIGSNSVLLNVQLVSYLREFCKAEWFFNEYDTGSLLLSWIEGHTLYLSSLLFLYLYTVGM